MVAIAGQAGQLRVARTATNRFLLERLAGLRAHFSADHDRAAAHFRTALALADELDADALPERLGLLSPVGLFLCDDRSVIELHRRVATQARDDGMIALVTQALTLERQKSAPA